ncbi:MAG: hypothetical protein KBB11_02595 [Bacteroidales bacterium]|nr:hypothetical protein [Bacteroidales bacterium]HOY39043.1 hypothetical protein [Bacteroidales bacterium]HQP03394.1 hypothetical protein [Bacteroidales bacterium]
MRSKGGFILNIVSAAVLIALFFSCTSEPSAKKLSFSVDNVHWLTNYQPGQDNKQLMLDYREAILGFVIPSIRQTESGYFNYEFTIKNTSSRKEKYYYKIYYQNETYKVPEVSDNSNQMHPYASENFYGSWEDTLLGFKPVGEIEPGEKKQIQDFFRIIGNPRDEKNCYFNGVNDRWKRNPRVGDYSILLVIATEVDIKKIPDYLQHINKTYKNDFVNPYYYFLYGDGAKLGDSFIKKYEAVLNVKAKPDLGAGIYAHDYDFRKTLNYSETFTCNCNNSRTIYENAAVQQFIHYVDRSSKMFNIPVITDVLNDGYSKEEYNWNNAFTRKEELIGITPTNAKYPCLTVSSDSVENKIVIQNPGATYGDWRKENVGIITRHGFTYGKITVKANLTELLNKDNVWNGITNAIWLIYQGGFGEESGWNLRRSCEKNGYMATYWGGTEEKRVNRVAYSEIDFEILKTVPYCPDNEYPPLYNEPVVNQKNPADWNVLMPEYIASLDNTIAVCCTNWDMACASPSNFGTGCNEIQYQGRKFHWFRWEDTYRAVIEKYFISDDEVFGRDYYYFQIDWQPDKIIWRIGPEKDKLFVVGFVDESISMIPNNQMLLIITQEFHNTQWWPGSPYLQENIPFPKNAITGEIYEITIE